MLSLSLGPEVRAPLGGPRYAEELLQRNSVGDDAVFVESRPDLWLVKADPGQIDVRLKADYRVHCTSRSHRPAADLNRGTRLVNDYQLSMAGNDDRRLTTEVGT